MKKTLIQTATSLSFISGLFFSSHLFSQCVDGPATPDITGNVPYGPPINWANPNRVEISDDLYARVTMDAGDTSKYLEVKDFDFLLPFTATILGIEVHIETNQEAGANYEDAGVQLLKAGVPTGTEKLNVMSWGNGPDAYNVLGGVGDLWGDTWTAGDLMDVDFGIIVRATRTAGIDNLQAYVDQIYIILYYDDGAGCVMPITLKAFAASLTSSGDVQVDWTTASENNNDYFTIERSTDGIAFSATGTADGAGNSDSDISYSFTDHSPAGGTLYYRIRQTDFNGNHSLSGMISVQVPVSDQYGIYPNPATGMVYISGPSASQAEIFSLSGALIRTESLNGNSVSLDGIQPGLYLVRLSGEAVAASTHRLIVQ